MESTTNLPPPLIAQAVAIAVCQGSRPQPSRRGMGAANALHDA